MQSDLAKLNQSLRSIDMPLSELAASAWVEMVGLVRGREMVTAANAGDAKAQAELKRTVNLARINAGLEACELPARDQLVLERLLTDQGRKSVIDALQAAHAGDPGARVALVEWLAAAAAPRREASRQGHDLNDVRQRHLPPPPPGGQAVQVGTRASGQRPISLPALSMRPAERAAAHTWPAARAPTQVGSNSRQAAAAAPNLRLSASDTRSRASAMSEHFAGEHEEFYGDPEDRDGDSAHSRDMARSRASQFHVYNRRKSALCVQPDITRSGVPTIRIEAAAAMPGSDSFAWNSKIIIQVTPSDLQLIALVVFGMLPKMELQHYGAANNKWGSIEHQGGHLYVKIAQDKEVRAVKVTPEYSFKFANLVLRQLRLAECNELNGGDILTSLRRTLLPMREAATGSGAWAEAQR